MAPSIGVNLRVTGHCDQGDRKYMEDVFSVAYQHTKEGQDLEYAYFGIFDGHGGKHAAIFAKEHLMDNIVSNPYFWSENDEDVLKAIKEGFLTTHQAMFKVLDTWPKTMSGLPSTSGTTASIAFIRRGKIFTGHVGDSGIVLGYQDPDSNVWLARPLTQDHKPESAMEIGRIQEAGGKVVWKAGVPRVVWNRPKIGHQGPVLRSTHIDEIPFLAVARSLGDLWSFNSASNQFVVSPEPDVNTMTIDVSRHRCLILGTDGLWNMIPPQRAVEVVQHIDRQNKMHATPDQPLPWTNPSKRLVNTALDYWMMNKLRADNCTAVTALLDPPGPPLTGLLMPVRKPEDVATDSAPTLPTSDKGIESSKERVQTPEHNPSELAALLSAPVVSDVTPVPPVLLETSLPLDTTPTQVATPLRVLRNRIPPSDSLENLDNKFSCKKAIPASTSSAPPLGSQLVGIRKKMVTVEPAYLSRKRPMTRSRLDVASEERNASDTENHINSSTNNSASSTSSSSKRSRKSLPVASLSPRSHRILRSGTSPQVVRSLRSQDPLNLRFGPTSTPIHLRRKRSRSFTPTKRRK
ncbi:putative Phosphatase 1D protein [Daphnia magna]|uniref:Putative Phosphatase 1D protein n=1 Tax=Daphnia magna TaxID=35525 RepID=A0A0P5UVU5_9CRUS|nr:putative Phosphatase 1D protein [Daphnia magna]